MALAILGVLLSGVWLALAGLYIDHQLGFQALRWLMPHELGAVVSGVVAPLVLLWLAFAYAGLSGRLRRLEADIEAEAAPVGAGTAERRIEPMIAGRAVSRDGDGAPVLHLERGRT